MKSEKWGIKLEKNGDVHILPWTIHTCKHLKDEDVRTMYISHIKSFEDKTLIKDKGYNNHCLHIELDKNNSVDIDILYCPFCGEKLAEELIK